jgi:protoheme IX farnesyltransferase
MILSLGLIPLYGFIAAITPLLAAIVILASSLKRGDYREGSFKAFKMVNVFTGLFFLLLMLP